MMDLPGGFDSRSHANAATMHVGIARLWLHMPENGSLKDKRQILRSVMQRLRNQFEVAVAEVGAQDDWHTGCIGLAAVGNDPALLERVLARAAGFVRETRLDADLYDSEIEVIAF